MNNIDEIILEELGYEYEFYIFGTSGMGKEFLESTSLKICGAFDNKNTEHFFENVPVLNINMLSELSDKSVILITSSYDKEIGKQLDNFKNIKWISIPFLKKIIIAENYINNPDINTIMLETTSYCNAICDFCPNSSMARKKEHMSEEVFEMALERVKELNKPPKIFRLHCLGEPLLSPNLVEYIKRLKKIYPDSEVGFTSNFSVANEDMIYKLLESGLDYITISLNSTNEDSYKNSMGKHMSYAGTLNNIRMLMNEIRIRDSKLKVSLSIVETKENVSEVEEFCNEWEKQNVDIRIMKLGNWIENENKESNVSTNEKRRIVKKCSFKTCPWTTSEICILSNGHYALCCFDSEGIQDMNVKNYSIKDVINSKLFKEIRKNLIYGVAENDLCKGCSFLGGKE